MHALPCKDAHAAAHWPQAASASVPSDAIMVSSTGKVLMSSSPTLAQAARQHSVLRDADDGEQRQEDVDDVQVDARQAYHISRQNACGALPARIVLHRPPKMN